MVTPTDRFEPLSGPSLNRALSMLMLFRALDPEMPMEAAKAFLTVASNEVTSITDLHRLGGFAPSSASRYFHYLSDRDRHGNRGHDLIESYRDPKDSRRKALRLTGRGELLVQLLAGLMVEGLTRSKFFPCTLGGPQRPSGRVLHGPG